MHNSKTHTDEDAQAHRGQHGHTPLSADRLGSASCSAALRGLRVFMAGNLAIDHERGGCTQVHHTNTVVSRRHRRALMGTLRVCTG